MMRHYISHYSNETYIKFGECGTSQQVLDRQDGLYKYGIRCVGERWVPGYGNTALWYGPVVDKTTQNLLNLDEWD